MKPLATAITLAAFMATTSVASMGARPAPRPVSTALSLEAVVPSAFGDWSLAPEKVSQVINPLVKDELDKLYSQILSRTYVDGSGYRVMLSIAYGDDQRGGLQTHRPEVCYPGQGFVLTNRSDGTLVTGFGAIDVRRLQTALGPRKEPVTYWLTVGDRVVNRQLDKRLAEIRVALTGQIPEGLLFRISSIDADTPRAFERQQQFAAQMLAAVPPKVRRQLSGLSTPGSPGE